MTERESHDNIELRPSSEFSARAVRHVVAEVVAAPPPELDWARLETRLLERLESERVTLRSTPPGSLGALFGFVAMAASVVLFVLGAGGPAATRAAATDQLVDVATLPVIDDALGAHSHLAASLAPGSALESGGAARRFVLPGVAAFMLAPGSRVVVRRTGEPYVLELAFGQVTAEVVPRHDTDAIVEAVIVESGGTRVAVHGTVFSVARSPERVEVEVTEGVVAVGPAGYRGDTTGHLLAAPSRATFAARDARLIEVYAPTRATMAAAATPRRDPASLLPAANPLGISRLAEPDAEREVHVRAASRQAPSAPGRDVRAEAVPQPLQGNPGTDATSPPAAGGEPSAAGAVAMSVADARAAMVSCLRRATANAPAASLSVSVSSQITVTLDGDDDVATVQFAPPLRPEIQGQCAGLLFGRAVAGAGSSFVIPFSSR